MEGTGLTPGDSMLAVAMLRLKKRKTEGLDSLIQTATTWFVALDSNTVSDSARLGGYFQGEALRIEYDRRYRRKVDAVAAMDSLLRIARRKLRADHPALATFYFFKGLYWSGTSQDSSVFYSHRALKILEKTPKPNSDVLIGTHLNLGRAAYFDSDLLRGMYHVEKALEALPDRISAVDSLNLGVILNMKAILHFGFQEYEEAAAGFERFRELSGPASPFLEANYKINLANVYAKMHNWERAIAINREALALNSSLPSPSGDLEILGKYNTGYYYLLTDRFDSAAVYLGEVLAKRLERPDYQPQFISYNRQNLARAYVGLNRLPEARKLLDQVTSFFRSTFPPFHPEWIYYHNAMSRYELAMGNPEKALEHIQQAINNTLRDPAGHPVTFNPGVDAILLKDFCLEDWVEKSQLQLALFEKTSQGKWLDECLKSIDAAVLLIDQMRSAYQYQRFKQALGDNAVRIYRTGVKAALRRWQRSGEVADLERAFQYATESKAGMLLDMQREYHARRYAGIPDSLLQREENWQNRIWRMETNLQMLLGRGEENVRDQVGALEDSLHNLRVRLSAFKRKTRDSFPRYQAFSGEPQRFSLRKLRDHLAEDAAVLDFSVDGDSLRIFAVTADSLKLASVEWAGPFQELLSDFQEAQAGEKSDFKNLADAGYRLYQKTIFPFEKLIAGKRLIVIPDRQLYQISFAALVTAPPDPVGVRSFGDLPFLIRRNSLRYGYSAELLAGEEQQNPLPPPGRFLAYAPGFTEGLPPDTLILEAMMNAGAVAAEVSGGGPLPYSREEVETIRDHFLAQNSGLPLWLARWFSRDTHLRIGRQASESHLFEEDLSRYRYVHLSTHGFFYETPIPFAGFVLYDDARNDGVLLPPDIYRLKLNAELVVLSACQTGRGTWSDGEGLVGPAQAFLQSGARNLLVTLWQTENRSARDLMVTFYDQILSGETLAEALRNAQLKMLDSEDFQHPLYWAPYVLVGR
ncbi:MAG: CHAT domain-containing protein [Calditrichaeota bacterium]|nr:CHAT domain-containing protein [Calditrichota bacterium]